MEKKKLTAWMFIVVAIFSGVVGTASAAVSPWPMEGGNRFHTRRTSIVGPTVPVLKWSVNVGGWGCGEPSIGLDGNIYVGSSDVYLAAVSPSGSVVWQRTDHNGSLTPSVGANGNLYTYLLSRIACLDPNGEVVWIGESYLGTEKSPTIAGDGSVYFNTTGKYTPDGDLIEPGFGHRGVSEPRDPTNPDVYFTSCDPWHGIGSFGAYYVGLNDNNEPVWKTHWSLSSAGCTFRSAAVVCRDGKVIVADVYSGATYLRAFSQGGDPLWTFGIHGIYSYKGMAIGSDGTIYASSNRKLYAINPDGSERWVTELDGGPPLVDGAGTVYCRTGTTLIAVAPDGSTKWVLDLPGGGGPPVFGNDGTMYIGVGGYLYAYDAALRLLAPNGGEDIMAGSTYTIQWETEGEISNVLIEYSTNNGSAWSAVDPPNVGNTGSYEWDPVPVADSNECLVRISDAGDPGVYDTSDGLFTIFVCQGPIVGDLNNDCYVNLPDFAILGDQWFQVPGVPSADIAPDGGDGWVNRLDLGRLTANWLRCGNPFDPACGLE